MSACKPEGQKATKENTKLEFVVIGDTAKQVISSMMIEQIWRKTIWLKKVLLFDTSAPILLMKLEISTKYKQSNMFTQLKPLADFCDIK